MIDTKTLEHMYQQWIQENETHVQRWFIFVEMAAENMMTTQSEVMKELVKCRWFERPKE